MQKYILGAVFALLAQPAFAQSASVAGVRDARPAVGRVVIDRTGPVVRDVRPADGRAVIERTGPVVRDQQTYREKAAELLQHAQRRAHNAVENGASPERVRHALQEYKQHLRARLNGAN